MASGYIPRWRTNLTEHDFLFVFLKIQIMAVNFLHHLFQTKIRCSAVSSDGYSPQNLVSESWRDRNRGFLASHFIKPPVCLVFQLPFPINVHSLIIKPKVGSQISSGVDVFVAGVKHDSLGEVAVKQDRKSRQKSSSSSVSSSSRNNIRSKTKRRKIESEIPCTGGEAQGLLSQDEEEKPKNFEVFAHKYSALITPDSFKNEHRNIFTLVSRANEPLGRTIRIINKRYGGQINPAVDSSGDAIIHEFFQSHTLNYVTHIVIVISRVKGSCVPGLGRLEIWGQASSCCGAHITTYVSDIQKKIMQNDNETPATDVTKNGNNDITDGDRVTYQDKHMEDEKDIPSEFVDPITCNLMTIPMLLPSGLNIDLSTLEKHIEVERSWGRLPSDPFTGVLFSDGMKPLPNGALKVRIDKYILMSGVDVRSCGRTVGRSGESIFPKTSLKTGFSSKALGNALNVKMNCKSLQNKTKEKYIENEKNGEVLGELKHLGYEKADCVDNVTKDAKKDIVQSHEEKVSESLDSALMKTLGGASFTRRDQSLKESVTSNKATVPCASSLVENLGKQAKFGIQNQTSTSKDSQHHKSNFSSSDCIGCKSPLNASLSMFQLPCKHLMCRKCLTEKSRVSKTLKCFSCGQEFERKDIIRVHQ
ncbi:RING finger protein 37-like [Actinia tenebrosa]|uniref:RING finger protein 37-like n=1 Tax=Actinia tenebrosa TaxID=6105 RepID=A0A6P8IJW8_ACTTE|nr:RING finger protein 37-like [Actinia tenebrosa]